MLKGGRLDFRLCGDSGKYLLDMDLTIFTYEAQ